MTIFQTRLREIRGTQTVAQAAAIVGVTQPAWSQWENGVREPKLEMVVQICRLFDASADYRLGLSDNRHGGGHVVHASGSAVAIGGNANAINGAAANCADCPLMQAAAKMAAATKKRGRRNA